MKRLFRKLLRHYFAAQAMKAFMSAPLNPPLRGAEPGETVGEYISRKSYLMADAMLAEGDK